MTIPRPMKHQWFHVLLALAERDLHGFGIQRSVLERTAGELRLWPAMLYRSLRTLVEEDLIRPVAGPREETVDERRQYYSLTVQGRTRLNEEAESLSSWAAAAKIHLADHRAG